MVRPSRDTADGVAAMSISRKTLTLVQRVLPSLCLSMLVMPPTQNILRAYHFERTPYKGQFYLWRIVMPLYRPAEDLLLNYSDRLAEGELLQLSQDIADETLGRGRKARLRRSSRAGENPPSE